MTPTQAISSQKYIRIRGAREHNLKGIDVDIPRDQLVVITGLSGSGKSTLAFDTVFAEGAAEVHGVAVDVRSAVFGSASKTRSR